MSAISERTIKQTGAVRRYLSGPLIGAAAGSAIMYGCALLFEKEILPYELLPQVTTACVFIGSTVGGIAAASARGKGRLAAGLLSGGIIFFVILIFSLACASGPSLTAQLIKMAIATLLGGMFGATLLSGSAAKMHKKKRRNRQ